MLTEAELERISSLLLPADRPFALPPDLRHAAVLMILYESERTPVLPLIERPEGQGVHSGQLALPGGAVEAQDGSLLRTALREAQEEVGVKPEELRVLGGLLPVRVSVSGFMVTPFVTWAASPPTLHPSDAEVARIVILPVASLTDPRVVRELPAPQGSAYKTVFEYHIPEGRVWGATARMLASLGDVLGVAGNG